MDHEALGHPQGKNPLTAARSSHPRDMTAGSSCVKSHTNIEKEI
jgi:hypothetical protein